MENGGIFIPIDTWGFSELNWRHNFPGGIIWKISRINHGFVFWGCSWFYTQMSKVENYMPYAYALILFAYCIILLSLPSCPLCLPMTSSLCRTSFVSVYNLTMKSSLSVYFTFQSLRIEMTNFQECFLFLKLCLQMPSSPWDSRILSQSSIPTKTGDYTNFDLPDLSAGTGAVKLHLIQFHLNLSD